MNRVELLSPAGDLERLKVTLLYGADAVYIGGKKYSLRANATNFTIKEIKEACLFAHNLHKKVYLTLNMVFHNSDLLDVKSYIKEVADAGIDAFIVSDLAIAKYIKDNYTVEVHISTQDSISNYEAVSFLEQEKMDRVVLARELSKDEIKEITTKTNIDIEVFIHGAMCTCISGRCALSNYITNRDANRGGCAQVCRFAFKTEDNDTFTMATKDLNMIEYIPDLIELGVESLKVEGRMRSLYYLATVIGTYRKVIDCYYNKSLTKEVMTSAKRILDSVANRDSTSQFFSHEADYNDEYFTGRQEISNQEYLGLIIGYDNKNNCLIIRERNYFKPGDLVEIFTPTKETYEYTIEEIYDEDMNLLEVARHPDQILKLKFSEKVAEYSMIRLIKKGD